MTAVLLHRSGDRATVRLTPGRIARWFGARAVDVELARIGNDWHTEATGRDIDYIRHGGKIKHALIFVPIADPPPAIAKLRP